MTFFQGQTLRVDVQEGVALLSLDQPGRSLNVLNRQLQHDLHAALDRLAGDSSVRLLILRSAKPAGFLAGADLYEFARLENAAEATSVSAAGQQLFDKLEHLRVPTVAVVHGPCLGGGLELTLACDYRVALDQPKTQFGQPEVELGLLPGWGGTQRLPRTVGLERALQIILGGRRLSAREALQWGLVDACQPGPPDSADQPTSWESWVPLSRLQKRPRQKLPRQTWKQRLVESNAVGRWLVFRGTQRLLRHKVPDDMPAPGEALRAVQVGLSRGVAAGLAYEREAAGRLATSPACRNLIQLFLQREAARKQPAEATSDAGGPIRRVGVVGAGTMGAGIAQLAALKGCEVVLQEVDETALGAGMLKVAGLFHQAAQRQLLSTEEANRRLSAVRGTTSWKGYEDVDLVVEAIVEDLEVKRRVFRELEDRTRATAILATNTSSLLVENLQDGLAHPERVAGLHFFNPVHKMPLVEVAHAPRTEPRVTARLAQWAAALGKTPVVVKDSPGFIVNRVLMPYLSEAVVLLTQKLPVRVIDGLMRRFGMPMGPLELLDQIGLDVARHVARTIYDPERPSEEGNRTAYAAGVAQLFDLMCERGWLGQKRGAGFYTYRGKSRLPHGAVEHLFRQRGFAGGGVQPERWLPPQPGEARDRLVLPMVNAAAACLSEGLVHDAAAIDLALVLGAGWAPHRGGPLHYADSRGLDEVVRVLEGLAQRVGPWFGSCAELRTRARDGKCFCPFKPPPA